MLHLIPRSADKMNIVLLLFNYKLSGGMRVINELSNGLVDRGHNVFIVVPKGSVELKFPIRAKVIEEGFHIKNHYFSSLLNLPLLAFATPKCDVIISTFSIMAYSTWLAAKLRGADAYNFVQGYETSYFSGLIRSRMLLWLYEKLIKLSYHLPLQFLVNSQWTAQMSALKNFAVIHPCVDQSVFNTRGNAEKTSRGQKQILTIGKKQPSKGLDDLLAALDIVHKQVDFKLTLLAPDKLNCDRPYIEDVKKVEDDEQMAEQYRWADLFVSSSWFEGFALPPLEAMACGTPVVLTDSGGVREYAVDGFNCLMVPPRQPGRLAQAILSVLNDDALAQKLAANGIRTAQEFRWEDSVAKLEQILLSNIRQGTEAANENPAY